MILQSSQRDNSQRRSRAAQKSPSNAQGRKWGDRGLRRNGGRLDGVSQGLLLSVAVFAGLSDRAGLVWPRLGLRLGSSNPPYAVAG
jgi:hypothetical protein